MKILGLIGCLLFMAVVGYFFMMKCAGFIEEIYMEEKDEEGSEK